MTTLFETYENEFKHCIRVIETKIEQLKTARNKQLILKEIETELEIAKDSVDQMTMVATSTYGGTLNAKVKEFALQLDKLRGESDKHARVPGYGDKTRTQILEGKKVLDRTGERLNDTVRVARQTEDIADITLINMVEQGEKLDNMLDVMDDVDNKVDTARNTLTRMSRGIITNKLILAFIIIVLIATIGFIVYFKWLTPLIKQLTPPVVPPVVPAPQPMSPISPSTTPSPPPVIITPTPLSPPPPVITTPPPPPPPPATTTVVTPSWTPSQV